MIGYCVPVNPRLASFRLRVAIPARFVGPHRIGGIGDVTFFFKNGNPDLARRLETTVYDVVNAHFEDPDYRAMCEIATTVTCSSKVMAGIIKEKTGRDAVVIPDPYENAEAKPEVKEGVLWFGHPANGESLRPYADLDLRVYGVGDWTLAGEAQALASAGVVLLTGNNPGASANRPIKALRAGRFVVAPSDSPTSWQELSPYIWLGDVRDGIQWALNHREEACQRVKSAQKLIRETFSPQSIGSQWAALFASTLGQVTNTKRAGSASISR